MSINKILFFVFCGILPLGMFAQSSYNSPYSRYGVGNLLYNRYTRNMAMGGLCYGVRNPSQINFANPASYTAFDTASFVFETGVVDNYVETSTALLSQKANQVSFGYLVFGFPVTRWWSSSIGLVPYTNTGYKMSTEIETPNIGTTRYYYEGNGGINQFYFGNAVRLFKKLSVGLNVSYLFGTMNQFRTVSFPDSVYYFSVYKNRATSISDFKFDGGIQYQFDLKKGWSLIPGIVFSNKTYLRAYNTTVSQTYTYTSSLITYKDTIENYENEKGKIILPLSIGGGFTLKKGETFLCGIDFSMQNWSQYRFFGESDSLTNLMHGAVGIQYTPNVFAAPLWKRMQYRIGARYDRTSLKIRKTQIEERSVSFGVGFPLRRTKTNINLGFEFGQLGTKHNGLIKERFGRATLGFSLWDRWFLRRKYD